MLVKIGNQWVDTSTVTGLTFRYNQFLERYDGNYKLYIHNDKGDFVCGIYENKQEVIKAMDEAAEKINTAQGLKSAKPKKVMMEKPDKGLDRDMYHCSHCNGSVPTDGKILLYKFCPHCGREIEGWTIVL